MINKRVSPKSYNGMYNRYVKRLLDLMIAIPLIIIASPFYGIIAIMIFLEDGRPIFYRPFRGGYKGKPFKIFKFRTMIKNADKIGGGTTSLHDPRITKVGRVLRKTKMDETANLLNIIIGTMSFVGPRPELLKYTEQYRGRELEILQVRPGVTDFSSLEFINLDEIVGDKDADGMYEKYVLKRKNKLRIKYAENVSLAVDCEIFFATVKSVVTKSYEYIIKKSHR